MTHKVGDINLALMKLNESEFNDAGYALIRAKRVKEAIEIFKLNTDAHPESSQRL